MPLDDSSFETFKHRVLTKTGIDLNGYKEKQMKRRIDSLIARFHLDTYDEYLSLLARDEVRFREFLDRLTINVSEFFRNPNRWDVLRDKIIPLLLASQPSSRLRAWSAACSTGEEPYSLAVLLSEGGHALNSSILATDIDATALARAQAGCFSTRSISSLPPALIEKYFVAANGDYVAANSLKRLIQFRRHDLITERFDSGFDLIICRNVMIYFTEEAKSNVYQKFSRALRPGGVLFVGSTEQIFNAKEIGLASVDAFFYQKV